jgi:NAD(P)-dependent dehydrogenase (short-subunit alcohol dehydrogenase family)
MIDLANKVVLVTGGSRGIGAATVRKVVAAGGAAIIHYGRNEQAARALAEQVGAEHTHLLQADLLSAAETEGLWDNAVAWRGHIDVLVNNAGVYEKNALALEIDEWLAGWDRTMRINLLSAAQLCRRAVQHFRERGGGILINVSSRAGHRGDSIDHLQYGASKAGMLALNRSIARNCAKENILAYGVAPGFVGTDMVQEIIDEQGLDKMRALYPTGRITTADEVASVILFLASGVAPQTTGNTIDLCGAADVR